ncbi:MAG: YjgP/YjgQ family permease [Flavobacteriaceae bacterium]|nr:YjgP/YjgQ family permease [Flavobacteriaceae bacterium]
MLVLFIPIGITINLAEKIDKMLANEVPAGEIIQFYLDFTVYFANLLLPLFLFLSVIWFTSKLANNTEVIAFISSGVSFYRFLRPYIIGASLVAAIALFLGMYLAPKASQGYNEFEYKYLKGGRKDKETSNIYRQINDNEIIFVSNFNTKDRRGSNFTLEHFEGNTLKYKISALNIIYNPADSTYRLTNYTKRIIGPERDTIINRRRVDTTFTFDMEDLTPVKYIAETLNYNELTRFINKETERGSSYIGRYQVVKFKKWSIPVSVFILTIIAVSVSSKKRRGGMGVNLALGILIAMIYIFFDKVFGVMAEQSDMPPFFAVWFPNLLFGTLAAYLLYNAKR